jgi:hypothetical protein
MLLRRLSLATLALLSASATLKADILVFKNGDRKEGTVLNESATSVRLRYQLTPKIPDEKDFPRADIVEIIRQRPSELALKNQKLAELIPTKDMMGADEYERLIQDRLRPFTNQFSGTPEATQVEQIIKDLQSEKEKVVSGQLKVDGKWLSPEEVKRDDYNIRAYRLRNEIKMTSASQKWEDWVAALRIYDRFIDPSTGFFASTHYPNLIPEVLEIMKNYEAILLKMIREQPILLKAQADSLGRLVEPDLTRTKNALKQATDGWKAQYDAEKRSRVRWLIPYKFDMASLNEAHKLLITERAKLQAVDVEALAKQNELLVAVFRYLADQNVVEAETALDSAVKAAGPSNRDYSKIFAELRNQVVSLKNDVQRKKNAQRAFNASSAAVGGGTGPIMDDRVAKALAEAEAGDKPATPETTDANAPIGDAPAAKPQTAPSTAPKASPTPAPVVEEEGGFPIGIALGGVALLGVLITVMMLQKKKSKSAADEE